MKLGLAPAVLSGKRVRKGTSSGRGARRSSSTARTARQGEKQVYGRDQVLDDDIAPRGVEINVSRSSKVTTWCAAGRVD